MSVAEAITSLSSLAIAVSLVVIALRVHAATVHLKTVAASLSSLNLWLYNYLAIRHTHEPDPHHHFKLKAPRGAVGVWHDGHWELRSEDVSLCNAGRRDAIARRQIRGRVRDRAASRRKK